MLFELLPKVKERVETFWDQDVLREGRNKKKSCEQAARQQLSFFLLLSHSCLHRPREHAVPAFCLSRSFEDMWENFHQAHCVPVFYTHECGMHMGVCHYGGFSCPSTFGMNIKFSRQHIADTTHPSEGSHSSERTSALAVRRSPTQLAHLARGLGVNHLADVELPVCTQTHRRACARTVHLICQL